MPYDENGQWYDTYGGSDTPPGSSWTYDPSPPYDPYGPRVEAPNTAITAAAKPDATMQAYLATIYGRQANGGTAARTPSTSMATAQGAYSAATGGAYDPTTSLTAYQQAQLNLSQQQLQQSAYQFQQTLSNQANIAAGNLGFNYAQLGQQGGQFQQNYGIDYQQLLNATNGTPFQWAGLGLNAQQIDQQQNLDQQRIDLSKQLGQGDDMRGWAQLALAEEDHDLRMYLGQGQLAQSQAEIAATMTRLGIDVYQTNVNAQIAQARLALDQQTAAAQAGALSAQAAAEAARAQAALRAVEVELQLGEGNLEQGYAKLDQAERFGLADISIRREELGLKDKVATQDLALQTMLGVEGINVSREKLANDKMLGISDQQTRRDIAQLNAQVERERMGQQGGQFQQQFGLDLAKAQSQENVAKWGIQASLRGPRDWAKAVEMRREMGGGDANNPFAALAPGAGQLSGNVGGPSEPISWQTFLQDNGLPSGTQFPSGAQTNQPWQGQAPGGGFDMNNSPWQQMVSGGFQAPTANPWSGQNLPTQGGTMDWNSIFAQITGQSGGTTAAGQGPLRRMDTNGWTPPGEINAGSLWDPNFTEGQPYTGQVAGSQIDPGFMDAAARATGTGGGNFADTPGWRKTTDANGNESWSAVQGPSANELTRFGGLPVQETYENARGEMYVVPAGYGPQSPGDKRIGGPAPKPQTEPIINANGTVTMPGGAVQDARGNPLPQGAQTNQPATFGQQQPAIGGYNGQFQAPTAGGFQPYNPGGFTGNFNGIPIPEVPQIQQPAVPGTGGPSVVAQMFAQYMSMFPTQQAQQTPQAQNALAYVMAMQAQARAQQPPAAVAPGTATPPTGTTPPATPPPTMNTGQPPSFQQPSYSNWLPAAQGYYGGGSIGTYGDSPGVYSTGGPALNPGLLPSEAGGSPAIQFGSKTSVRSPLDAYAQQQQAAHPQAGSGMRNPMAQNTSAYNNAITGGPVPHTTNPAVQQPQPTVNQWTNPNYAQPTQSTNMPTYPNLASTANWGQDPHAGTSEGAAGNPAYANSTYDMPESTGQQSPYNAYAAYGFPQYAMGTRRVPVTGPAIVHEGEAIVPAAQNPANQNFVAPVTGQPAQVQQATPPAVPANPDDLVNPQAPLQPNQQQLAANQQPQQNLAQAPQPVANAPQHAQPTSTPAATVETAGLTPQNLTQPGFQAPTVPAPGTQFADQATAQATWNAAPVTTSPAQYRDVTPQGTGMVMQPTAQPVQDTAYWQQRLAFLEQSVQGTWDPAAQAQYRQQADAIRAKLATMQQPAAPVAAAPMATAPGEPTGQFQAPVATPPANPLATSAALYNGQTPTPTPVAGQNPFVVTPGQPQFNQPVTGQASPQNPFGRLFASLPAPNQVSYRTWTQDLSPSEKEMALGAWEAQGWYIPDVQDLIERNRFTRQQGAYAGGYAGVGR